MTLYRCRFALYRKGTGIDGGIIEAKKIKYKTIGIVSQETDTLI